MEFSYSILYQSTLKSDPLFWPKFVVQEHRGTLNVCLTEQGKGYAPMANGKKAMSMRQLITKWFLTWGIFG